MSLLSRKASSLKTGFILGLLALVLFAIPAQAEESRPLRGVALVIGNNKYEHLGHLPNPGNDASAIGTLLDELGFEMTVRKDRTVEEMQVDFTRFVEDAKGADVAFVYVAGHGIEAGGENFLVPIDADATALEALQHHLIPLSPLVAQLRATVPVTIVLLDACRDNPFPAGAIARFEPGAAPVSIGERGLTLRSAESISEGDPKPDGLGIVIGFAAQPGERAEDGAPGDNSPYAAALLRHLGVLPDYEFEMVMRMVGEEVYLKTQGRQRPWKNTSLFDQLFFGRAQRVVAGEEGEIVAERRQLLLTMTGLPKHEREQVEAAAAASGVPMDALYAMLKALGQDIPADPVELERLLLSQAERVKGLLAERATLKSTDAEILRLSALADRALADGALATAMRLHEAAKARVTELAKTLETAEADIRARRIEFAEVYARSAETSALAFEHLSAADDYARAFEHVARWDDILAWRYKQAEIEALIARGNHRNDIDALRRAVEAARLSSGLVQKIGALDGWASTQHNLGNTLRALGERLAGRAGVEHLTAAADAFQAALTVWTREKNPVEWAGSQIGLGNASLTLSERTGDRDALEVAIIAFEGASAVTRESSPTDWAGAQDSLGRALQGLGTGESSAARFAEAAAHHRAALGVFTRELAPLRRADVRNNLGNALAGEAERLPPGNERGILLRQAETEFRAALEEYPRPRSPARWARIHVNLGKALTSLGETGDVVVLRAGVDALRSALLELTRENAPMEWALAQSNLGYALAALGNFDDGTTNLEEAQAAYRNALKVIARGDNEFIWARIRFYMGVPLAELGRRTSHRPHVAAGRDAVAEALEVFRRYRLTAEISQAEQTLKQIDDLLRAMP